MMVQSLNALEKRDTVQYVCTAETAYSICFI